MRLYTIANGEEAAALDTETAPQSISFSENGTWLASAGQNQTTVSIWDLRKAAVVDTVDAENGEVSSAKWDYSGQFLAIAGTSGVAVHQYDKKSKKWSEPFQKAIPARNLAWGANAQSLVALTTQGALTVLGSAE